MEKPDLGWWSFRLSPEVRKQLAKNDHCARLIKSYLNALVRQGARFVRIEGADLGLDELVNREYLDESKSGTHMIELSDLDNLSILPFTKVLHRNEHWPVPKYWNPNITDSDELRRMDKAEHIRQAVKVLTNYLIPYFIDTEENWYIFDRYAIDKVKNPNDFIRRRMLPLILVFQLIDRVRAGKISTIHICCWSTKNNSADDKEIALNFKQDIKRFKDQLSSSEVQKILNDNRDENQSKISMKFYNTRSTRDLPLNNHERVLIGNYWGLYMGQGLEELSKYLLPPTRNEPLPHLSIFPSTAHRGMGLSGAVEMELIDKISRAGVDWCTKQAPVDEITIMQTQPGDDAEMSVPVDQAHP